MREYAGVPASEPFSRTFFKNLPFSPVLDTLPPAQADLSPRDVQCIENPDC